MFIHSPLCQSPGLTLSTDSSGFWGCAAIFRQGYTVLEWPPQTARTNLSLLEFYSIVVAVHLWADQLKMVNCLWNATIWVPYLS